MNQLKSTPPTKTYCNEEVVIKYKQFKNGRNVPGLYTKDTLKLIKWLSDSELAIAIDLNTQVIA